MNRQALHQVIIDQQQEIEALFKSQKLIPRELYTRHKSLLSSPLIKVIMGVRRCGKSVFATQLLRDHPFAYLNFDDERLIGIKPSSLNTILEIFLELHGKPSAILFDEIQNVPGWELFLNRLQRQGLNIIITGSSANLLSRELATHLTGRHHALELFPFSFREFLTYNGIASSPPFTTEEKALIRRQLSAYLHAGGFPETLKDNILPQSYLRGLYADIIEKDIVMRHKIRMVQTLKEISLYLVNNHAARMSYNKLARTFQIKSVHTVMDYTAYLEEAYLFFFLQRWSSKQKERSTAPRKVFVIDQGMITALGTKLSPGWGRLYENVVAVELARRISGKPGRLYYWQDSQQHEVDFVLHAEGEVKELIQVCYHPADDRIRNREFRSLVKSSAELGCRNLTVITDEDDRIETLGGQEIRHIPLWRWLLD